MTNRTFNNLFLAVLLFFVGTSISLAQDNTPDESVSYGAFTLYGNFPLKGDFSDVAKFGGGIGFEGAYYFHPLIGFAYSIDGQFNPYKKESNIFNNVSNIDAQPWLYGNLMGGLELSFPITPVVAPEFRALGGLMVARQPEITYNALGGSLTQQSVVAPAFSYAVSGGLKFTNYASGSAFRVGVRYLAAKPTFDGDNNIFGDNKYKLNITNAQLYVSFAFLSRK